MIITNMCRSEGASNSRRRQTEARMSQSLIQQGGESDLERQAPSRADSVQYEVDEDQPPEP